MSSEEINRKYIEESWEEVRRKVCNKELDYNNIEELKKLDFFNRFDDMLNTSGQFAVVKLSEIDLLLRACGGEHKDKDRFIPLKKCDGQKWEEHKGALSTNRYNDPERGFMYFGISMENDIKDYTFVKKTCAKEIRAFNNSNVEYLSALKFNIIDEYKNEKVLDFSKISDYYSCNDIEREMNTIISELIEDYNKMVLSIDKKIPKNVFAQPICTIPQITSKVINNPIVKFINKNIMEEFLVKIYLKLINDSTFKEINKSTSTPAKIKEEYIPFHVFANYIEYMGYAGIIYSSTVQKNGLNLVLFDRDLVEFYGDIEITKNI